ncbi:MAG: HAMP domain-containing histidine kinase [Acidimicrobiia bacterium]|nr:HAMP domain-containing histidine kinase [Acidimicrobiia bacterium]
MNRSSLRFRVSMSAVVATTLVLLAGSAALVAFQRASLTATLDDALYQRAADVEAQFDRFGPDLEIGDTPEQFVQLVGPDGTVLASSPNLDGDGPLDIADAVDGTDTFRTVEGLPVDDDSFRVLTRRIGGLGTLHVGTSADVIAESVTALIGGLAITLPVLDIALAAVTWIFVGRTLRPVQAITDEVEAIGATELTRRVPHPGTGDEIGSLADTVNRMLGRLQRANDRQRRFVADASHELRSPLTRLRTSLEVELADPEDTERALREALVQVVEMQELTEDLLQLARAEEGLDLYRPGPVDLDDLVLRELDRLVSRGRVGVDRSGLSAAHVRGDRAQLTRLVRNLLDNAERHAASTVRVALREEGDEAVLVVSDDGPGVPPEAAQAIFERFGRADPSRSGETGGAGLGLAIAAEIALRHQGALRLLPGGHGASFELRIPAAI